MHRNIALTMAGPFGQRAWHQLLQAQCSCVDDCGHLMSCLGRIEWMEVVMEVGVPQTRQPSSGQQWDPAAAEVKARAG